MSANTELNEKTSLILGPYKEPLAVNRNGFGYIGALIFDTYGRLQCHLCGELFDNLNVHIRTHGLTIKEYKDKFQLATSTRLVSERYREQLKSRFVRWNLTATAEEKAAALAKGRKKWEEWWQDSGKEKSLEAAQKGLSLEDKNKRGICPDQLISLIQKAAKENGGVISMNEFQEHYQTGRFFLPIRRTFGSWKRALKIAGLTQKNTKGKRAAYLSDDYLLEMLLGFYEERGVMPTASDCRRGFLPSAAIYTKRFGSFPKAREAAGLPDWGDLRRRPRKEIFKFKKPSALARR